MDFFSFAVKLTLATMLVCTFTAAAPFPQGTAGASVAVGPLVTGPRAPAAPLFTPEVAAATQHFMQVYNEQALIAAQFPDDPAPGQVAAPSAPQFSIFPVPSALPQATSATSASSNAPPNTLGTFSHRSGAIGASAGQIATTHTIPEAYAQLYALLTPVPAVSSISL